MFLSGVFIPIVMTGLDQDMMQKNLTCRTLRDAQKNMICYGICFVPVNALLLFLGGLLAVFASRQGITLPDDTDAILPMLATGHLGHAVYILFIIGIIAAAFSSADSALTALTTSVMLDQLGITDDGQRSVRIRKYVHIAVTLVFFAAICGIEAFNSRTLLDAVYTIAAYTYGPLLGLFIFQMAFSRLSIRFQKSKAPAGATVVTACIAAPVICFVLQHSAAKLWGYTFGYELLIINALIFFTVLLADSNKKKRNFA